MNRTKIIDKKYKFPFIAVTPKNMKENLPLIIQLHGAGERGDGSNLEAVDGYGFATVFSGDREIDCVLIEPQCPCDSFWVANIPFIKDFILQIAEEYKCDKKRIYLTGMSMGGYGTWFTAMAYPEMFAAIAPCCGGGMCWNAGVLTMPAWAFHGEDDDAVPLYESIDMVNAMKKQGLDAKLTTYPKTGHDSWLKAYNDELLNWLLSKSL